MRAATRGSTVKTMSRLPLLPKVAGLVYRRPAALAEAHSKESETFANRAATADLVLELVAAAVVALRGRMETAQPAAAVEAFRAAAAAAVPMVERLAPHRI